MPALVKSSVGSLWGTSEEEWTRRCPLVSKKRRKVSRISEPDMYRIRTFSLRYSGSDGPPAPASNDRSPGIPALRRGVETNRRFHRGCGPGYAFVGEPARRPL